MATMQIKSMDEQLYKALKMIAKADNRSLSQQVIMILKQYLSAPKKNQQQPAERFLELAGSWKDNRDAETIIKDIMADRSSKRFNRMENTDVFD